MHYTQNVNAQTTHLTVRKVPAKLAKALKLESKKRGKSLNALVIEMLSAAAGLSPAPETTNGLEKLAGTWTAEEAAQMQRALKDLRKIDRDSWK